MKYQFTQLLQNLTVNSKNAYGSFLSSFRDYTIVYPTEKTDILPWPIQYSQGFCSQLSNLHPETGPSERLQQFWFQPWENNTKQTANGSCICRPLCLPKSANNQFSYLMVFVDQFSNFTTVELLQSCNSREITERLIRLCSKFGMPNKQQI